MTRRWIDLSHPLYDGMPAYPTDPPVRFRPFKTIRENRSGVTALSLGTHTGTHVDAPSHVIENGKGLDELDLSRFQGLAIKLRLDRYEDYNLEAFQGHDGVLLETGWGRHFGNPALYFGDARPFIPLSVMEDLSRMGVKFFGCDLPSVDRSGAREKIIHRGLLSNDVVIYENLANLHLLPDVTTFLFMGFPLPLSGGDGSPVRAVALLTDEVDE